MFGPPVAAYIQYYIQKCAFPPCGFGPLLLNPGDGPEPTASFCIALFVTGMAFSKTQILPSANALLAPGKRGGAACADRANFHSHAVILMFPPTNKHFCAKNNFSESCGKNRRLLSEKVSAVRPLIETIFAAKVNRIQTNLNSAVHSR